MKRRTCFSLALSIALAGVLSAATVSYNPAPTTDTGWNPCGNFPGYTCRTTADFGTSTLNTVYDNGLGTLYENAFNAWNATGGGQNWTLVNGGTVSGSFDVTTATAQQFAGVTLGGLTINIDVSNITLPTLGAGDSLVWSQGLYLNFVVPAGTIVTPYFAMDTTTLSGLTCGGVTGRQCPPAYPYTYPDNSFYDQPKDYYMPPGTSQAFFDANVYLSIINYGTKTLTAYDGISYGFENFVSPEPGVWLLFSSGILLLLVIRRRRLV